MRYKTESSVLRTLSHKETIGKWWCLFDVLIPSSSNGADPPPNILISPLLSLAQPPALLRCWLYDCRVTILVDTI